MPQSTFNNVMVLREEWVGSGKELIFPDMSSCTAVVACLSDTLVGAHFVKDLWENASPNHTRTTNLLDRLKQAIPADEQIEHLLIVGFNGNHNPKKIADYLEVGGGKWEAYDIARKGEKTFVLVFTYVGSGVRPKVNLKKAKNVQIGNIVKKLSNPTGKGGKIYDQVTMTGKIPELRKHFIKGN